MSSPSLSAPDSTDKRIPSLDGLRALAIALVLAAHAAHSYQPATLTALYQASAFQLGALGVRVFFVVSGFLITRLLLREGERAPNGRIDVPRFLFSRALRIFPAYYAFLLGVALLSRAGLPVSRDEMLSALLYLSNYREPGEYLRHGWSLAVEEQFYLLWPALLWAFGVRRAGVLAGAIFVLCPLVRAFYLSTWGGAGVQTRFECVADALATGCLLAVFAPRLEASRAYRAFVGSRRVWIVPVAVLALSLSAFPDGGKLPFSYHAFGVSLHNLLIALSVHAAILGANSRAGRLLNARPVAFVGALSYSIYLWQALFLHPETPRIPFPLNFLGVMVAASASFYLVERPFLRLRARVLKRDVSPRRPRSWQGMAKRVRHRA